MENNNARAICLKEGLAARSLQALGGGQVNQVFLVDGEYVLRIGGREDAFSRLKRETDLLQSLAGKIPVPKIHAFGELDGWVYQIQAYIPGQKLYMVWKDLRSADQEAIVADLAAALKVIHGTGFQDYGNYREENKRYLSWSDYILGKFEQTLVAIRALNLRMAPGFLEMAQAYFDDHRQVLQGGSPALVHGDLSMVNILVEGRRLSALLDFEYALQAPADYELSVMEAFCLYPDDWAEEENEHFCTADYASFFPLMRKHYPALFEIEHLRERVNLYQLGAALSSYVAWRKDNLKTIPPEKMAAKEFYMARITNFVFRHGVRMF